MYRDVGATELRARVVELEEALARQRQRADDASSALDRANRLLNRKQALVQELWTKSNHFEKKARPKASRPRVKRVLNWKAAYAALATGLTIGFAGGAALPAKLAITIAVTFAASIFLDAL